MSASQLVVDPAVIRATVRLAAVEVPGVVRVGRSGGRLRRWLVGPALTTRLAGSVASVDIAIVVQPGGSLPLVAGRVRAAINAALERQLGLVAGPVSVTVDGVGD